ncbi:argininosuccinate synthase domain-containing protein [Streptomyces flavidovirens]|uniref:argininosuccinate synthase domain-containing protein n=1 Tax=Streptomyces flavidovirens TaxID=67298 RepID=UPI0034299C4F
MPWQQHETGEPAHRRRPEHRAQAHPVTQQAGHRGRRGLPGGQRGRPLIGDLLVETAHAYDCGAVAHGCTGKGNDQVRLDLTVALRDCSLRILAPAGEWKSAAAWIPAAVRRWGPWTVMVGASVGTSAILSVLALTDSLGLWFLLRFALGACAVAMFLLSETWISAIASDANRARLFTAYTSVLASASASDRPC